MNNTNTILSYCSNNPFLFYHHSITPSSESPLVYENETHPGYEILQLISGRVKYYIEGNEYVVNKGDVIILKSNEVHKLVVDLSNGYDRRVIQFSNELFPSNTQVNGLLVLGVLESLDSSMRVIPFSVVKKLEIDQIFSKFDDYAKSADEFVVARFAMGVIDLFIAFNNAIKELSGLNLVKTENELIQKISAYIIKNVQNKITIKDIAKHVNFSESRLCHVFRETMGFSIHKYVVLKRVQHAQNLIKHGYTLSQASALSGYEYYSTFYNNYKSLIGEPPSTENIRKW